MQIAMLGSGFIARFYADTLKAQRRKDIITSVYSRSLDSARNFSQDYQIRYFSIDMDEAINRSDVDVVVIALPNHLHEEAVKACAKAGKHVLCTKPLARTAEEAKRMLKLVRSAGIFAGYLEDLCYTPKFLKASESIRNGSIGKVTRVKSIEAHPGPHSAWFWNSELSGGGAMIDMSCHCIEICRGYIGKDIRPVEVMCWAATQVHPIDNEDNAIGLVKYANGAIGQFEISWTFRGGMDLREEIMGTDGVIWLNGFLRTGFDMFSIGKGGYVAEKAEIDKGWLFPVADESHELGYAHMFTDMFDSIENNREPMETFYDGYIVNTIIDAAYRSVKSRQWEPVLIDEWNGKEEIENTENILMYDDKHVLIKEELLRSGETKFILKEKGTNKIIQKIAVKKIAIVGI